MAGSLSLPPLDSEFKLAGQAGGAGGVFLAWEGVLRAGLASTNSTPSPVTVLTVHDTVWKEKIQSPQDPLTSDPIFQRQVVSSQVVGYNIAQDTAGLVKTVGGRSLVIKRDSGQLTVNDVPVSHVITSGTNQIWLLEKLLFIRPEDIELGVGRVRGDVK